MGSGGLSPDVGTEALPVRDEGSHSLRGAQTWCLAWEHTPHYSELAGFRGGLGTTEQMFAWKGDRA